MRLQLVNIFFNDKIIQKFCFVIWEIYKAKTFLFHQLPTRCSNGKVVGFLWSGKDWPISQVSFVFIHFFILLILSLCIAFPHLHWNSSSKTLLLWVSTEARDGKGLLGHPVSLAAGEARRGQQRGDVFEFPLLCFQETTGTSKVMPSSYLCFLLSTNGPGPCNLSIFFKHGIMNKALVFNTESEICERN